MRRVGLLAFTISAVACTRPGAPESEVRAAPAGSGSAVEASAAAPEHEPAEAAGETGVAEPTQHASEDGLFMAAGAPSPRACAVAADCLADTIPDLDQPCCANPLTLEPHARAYRRWVQEWRAEHCDAVTCPPPPAPGPPPDCAFEVACEQGRCVDSCPAASP